MAVLISKATGNWTAAGTWEVVDSTSYLNSEDGFATPPSSAGGTARSSSFTPGAIQIDAIAVKVYTVTQGGSPDLSLTVNLYNVTGAADVAGTSVTINLSDVNLNAVHTISGNPGGWLVFKFSAPVTLSAATAYAVQCVCTDGLSVQLLTDSTTNNWSRMLRTTTTKAPNSGSPDAPDDMVVAGEYTGPGTSNSYTVTMDNTSSTIDYGTDTTSIRTPSLAICSKGTLSFGTTAATNYYLKISGWVVVYAGGTLNIGTTGTPTPRDSTAVLEIDNNSSNRAMSLIIWEGGTFVAQGLSRTSGKNVPWCLLTADAAVGATTLNVDRDTGWLSGDRIVVAPAVSYTNSYDNLILTANAGASSMTVRSYAGSPDVGTANIHLGTNAPLVDEVINLTRNVKIRSSNSTNKIAVDFYDGSVVDIDWTEFQYTDTLKLHLGRITTKAVNFSMQFSSLYESSSTGFEWVVYVNTTNFTITNLVFSNNVGHTPAVERWLYIDSWFVPTNWTVDSNVCIGGNFYVGDLGGTFTNNRTSSNSNTGIVITNANGQHEAIGTFNNLYSHAAGSYGISPQNINASGTLSNLTAYHNGYGITTINCAGNIVIDTVALAGNQTASLYVNSSMIIFRNVTIGGTSYQATQTGYYSQYADRQIVENGSISVVSGVYTACNYDTYITQGLVTFRNVTLAGANETYQASFYYSINSFLRMEKVDGIAGNHKTFMSTGYATTDATIYRSYAPSVRMTLAPGRSGHSTMKLESAPRRNGIKVPVSNGMALTASIWVRMSTAGDGTAYDGSGPRLVVRSNPAVGIMGDMVLATVPIVGASPDISGTWRQLIGTTQRATDDGVMEFIVDIDGTAGWVNIDDFQFAEVTRSDYRGPGDIVPGAWAYWGLRAYSAATIGRNAVRLRRSSDNAESDFTTIAGGGLDVEAIRLWGLTNALYVRTLYDQAYTGSPDTARDMVQTDATKQPELRLNGPRGQPYVMNNGNRRMVMEIASCPSSRPITICVVFNNVSGSDGILFGVNNADFQVRFGYISSTQFLLYGGDYLVGQYVVNKWSRMLAYFDGTSSEAFLDGVSFVGTTGSTAPSASINIMADSSIGNPFIGWVTEWAVYNSAFNTPQKFAMDFNQREYWGI